VQEFFDSLDDKQAEKILWVLRLVRECDRVPKQYLKKLVNTDGLWEIRTSQSGNTFRLIGFFDGDQLIVFNQRISEEDTENTKKRNRSG